MGGRPALAEGTYGKIRFRDLPDGRVQARALYRDFDGHSRPVTKIGASDTAAERLLQRALRDRQRVLGDNLITSNMKVDKLADLWLQRVDASDKAVNTKQQYRKVVNAYIRPALGHRRVGECTVPVVDRALANIAADRGASVWKSARSALSGMLGFAVRHGAMPVNPVRDTEAVEGASKPKKGRPRSLTPPETEDITDRLRTLRRATELDLPDLVDFMLATGCRIGEALACREGVNADGEPLLDLEAGTWEVNATVIRVLGVKRRNALEAKDRRTWEEDEELRALLTLPPGMYVQERPKTAAGWRILALPPFAVEMLRGRRLQARIRGPQGVVFGSPTRRTLRDPSNTAGDLKEALALLDYDWPTFHTFRKTVATRMKEAGCSDIEVADQLGHANPSMTRNVYMGRNVTSARAASILDR